MEKDILRLLKGYEQFHDQHFGAQKSTFSQLVERGQQPKILMIACSDSRVDPALIMNCEQGDLFMVRNVANLVPPYENDQAYHGTSAALEFGVCVLEVRHVILFGHTQCGGIQSLLTSSPQDYGEKSFLTKWMSLATEARDKAKALPADQPLEEKVNLCGHYSLIHSLENLHTFPWIEQKVKEGRLALHAWNFNMQKGILEAYDPAQKRFQEISPAPA